MEKPIKKKKRISSFLALAQVFETLRYSFFNIAAFQILYKFCIFAVFMPVINTVTTLTLMGGGFGVALNDQIKDFLLSPFGVILIIIAVPFAALIIYYEFAVSIIFINAGYKREKISLWYGLVAGFESLRLLMSKSTIGLVVYLLAILPLIGIGFSSSLMPDLTVPEFIIGEIVKFQIELLLWIFLLILLVCVALFIVFIKLLFIFPVMVLENKTFFKGVKRSAALIKRNAAKALITMVGTVCVWSLLMGVFFLMREWRGDEHDVFAAIITILIALIGMLSSPLFLIIALVCYKQAIQINEGTEPETKAFSEDGVRRKLEKVTNTIYNRGEKIIAFFSRIWHTKAPVKIKEYPTIFVLILTIPVALIIFGTAYINNNSYEHGDFLVIGHRGSMEGVENTMGAIEAAIGHRADYVEIDVMLSKDGVLMLFHDKDLSRLAGINKGVHELTAEELKTYTLWQNDYTDYMVTLDEAFTLIDGRVKLLIEPKLHGYETESIVDKIAEVVMKHGAEEETMYHTLDMDVLLEMKEKYPHYRVGYVVYRNVGRITPMALRLLPADFYSIEQSMVTKRLVNICHRANKPIFVWTVNNPSQMEAMKSFNVDGVITDFPGM